MLRGQTNSSTLNYNINIYIKMCSLQIALNETVVLVKAIWYLNCERMKHPDCKLNWLTFKNKRLRNWEAENKSFLPMCRIKRINLTWIKIKLLELIKNENFVQKIRINFFKFKYCVCLFCILVKFCSNGFFLMRILLERT